MVGGNDAHAKKAVGILGAWAATLKGMEGRDLALSAGVNGFKFVNPNATSSCACGSSFSA